MSTKVDLKNSGWGGGGWRGEAHRSVSGTCLDGAWAEQYGLWYNSGNSGDARLNPNSKFGARRRPMGRVGFGSGLVSSGPKHFVNTVQFRGHLTKFKIPGVIPGTPYEIQNSWWSRVWGGCEVAASLCKFFLLVRLQFKNLRI